MPTEAIKDFINSLTPLNEEEFFALQNILSFKRLEKKEFFLREGQVCKQLGLITKGYVRLFYLKEGEEITKDFNFENIICGSYASFSLQQPSLFNIVAMEDTELYIMGRNDLYNLFETYPNIQKLGRLQIERMFIRKELREASFLLDTAEERYRKLLNDSPQMNERVPLKYLASYLGMTAETLSRIRKNYATKQ